MSRLDRMLFGGFCDNPREIKLDESYPLLCGVWRRSRTGFIRRGVRTLNRRETVIAQDTTDACLILTSTAHTIHECSCPSFALIAEGDFHEAEAHNGTIPDAGDGAASTPRLAIRWNAELLSHRPGFPDAVATPAFGCGREAAGPLPGFDLRRRWRYAMIPADGSSHHSTG